MSHMADEFQTENSQGSKVTTCLHSLWGRSRRVMVIIIHVQTASESFVMNLKALTDSTKYPVANATTQNDSDSEPDTKSHHQQHQHVSIEEVEGVTQGVQQMQPDLPMSDLSDGNGDAKTGQQNHLIVRAGWSW